MNVNTMKRFSATLFAAVMIAGISAEVKVSSLEVEGFKAPLNIENDNPRLSWIITSDRRNVAQTGYRILVASSPEMLSSGRADVWDSGRVDSDRSVGVSYDGPALADNRRVYWKVKVFTNHGETPWSEVSQWGVGQRGEGHWRGKWIGWDEPFAWDVEDAHSQLSSRYLRREFATRANPIKRATLHVSGLGLYELFINGKRVGEDCLTPSPTDYRRTVLYDTYDVSSLLNEGGENAVGVTLGNGRYYTMHQHYKPHKVVNFGYPKLRLNLVIEYEDGKTERINSDDKWKLTARGPIRSNNEYDGEIYDARLDLGDWTKAGYVDSAWLPVRLAAPPYGSLRSAKSQPMRVMRRVKPISVRRVEDRYIVDFGENMAGWIRTAMRGLDEGDTVTVRYSERIKPDSLELDTENLRNARSTDCYIASGHENGEAWGPRFSYHGFQFAEIAGLDSLTPDDLTAEVIYDNVADNGNFVCSNDIMNAIFANARRGVAANYKGMPVDCPQRDERQPWLGDHVIGTWGENFMYDNALLYAKWMDDIRESQREDGVIPDIAPAYYNYYNADMTWSSALPLGCEMLYEQTGDLRPISRNYQAMKKWMNRIRTDYTDRDGLVTADKYGDWCVPPEDKKLIHSQDPARKTDQRLIASAYYYKISRLMARFAGLLGLEADVKDWEADAEKIKKTFNEKFLTVKPGTSPVSKPHILYPDSIYYGNNTATSNVLPLAFDMVPEEYRQAVADNLVKTIILTNGGTISTGVIGGNWLMRELSRMGRGDVAMMLASNTIYPSWGYQVAQGATTIWELWNGDTASRKMNSNNHVMMLGDLITWYFRDLAGFNPAEPGYKKIKLAPDFNIPGLDSVSASYNTPYGLLSGVWHKIPTSLDWEVEVPCNTTAVLRVPTPRKGDVSAPGMKYLSSDSLYSYWETGSGKWHVEARLDPSVGEGREAVVDDEFIYERSSFPECHASTILELDNGDLLTAFFGGTKEKNPDCVIWVSRKPRGASEWSEPQIAADGVFSLTDPQVSRAGLSGIDSLSTPAEAGPVGPQFVGDLSQARRKACWNPVLFQIPGTDEILLFFKIGSSVGDWTGWLIRSKDGGRTWGPREVLPEDCLGPIKNKPEYIDGRIIAPSSRENKGWHAVMELSDDNGKTWRTTGWLPTGQANRSDRDYPEDIYAIQPSILRLADGRLQILCRTRNSRLAASWSNDNGETWSEVTLTDMPNNNSGTDAVTLADGRHVLIYNDFATIPGTPKGVRTPLCVAISDDGINWRRLAVLETSPVSQYSYPSIIQGRDGKLHAVWTWRRQRIKHAVIDPD